jgi:hypothetical protein
MPSLHACTTKRRFGQECKPAILTAALDGDSNFGYLEGQGRRLGCGWPVGRRTVKGVRNGRGISRGGHVVEPVTRSSAY